MLDFAALKAAVPIAQVLAAYGIAGNLRAAGPERLIGPCPLHRGDNPTAFRIHLTRNVWRCFTRCARGGNVLELVARLEGISIYQAGLRLQALVAQHPFAAADKPAVIHSGQARALGFRLSLAWHPYLHERGLTPQTCREFGVGYCRHGMMQGRIAFPIHDHDGRLVAYAGRSLSDDPGVPKYLLPRGFCKRQVLFNAWRVPNPHCQEVVVVE